MYLEPIDNMAFDVDEFIKPLSFTKKMTEVEVDGDEIYIFLRGKLKNEEYHFIVNRYTRCTIHVERIVGSDWLLNVNCCHCSRNNKIWRLLSRHGLV